MSPGRSVDQQRAESSTASQKNLDGTPPLRLSLSASHQVSGANWTMCSFPFASMT